MPEDKDFNETAIERLKRLGGNKLVREIIQSFLENIPKRIGAAFEGEKAGDFKIIEQAVHSIKSSAGNIGAVRLQKLAEEVEQLSSGKNTERIRPLLQELHEAFVHAKTYLKEIENRREE